MTATDKVLLPHAGLLLVGPFPIATAHTRLRQGDGTIHPPVRFTSKCIKRFLRSRIVSRYSTSLRFKGRPSIPWNLFIAVSKRTLWKSPVCNFRPEASFTFSIGQPACFVGRNTRSPSLPNSAKVEEARVLNAKTARLPLCCSTTRRGNLYVYVADLRHHTISTSPARTAALSSGVKTDFQFAVIAGRR